MFCCTICRVNALGIDMEEIFATPCGHVFHKKCIEFCLLKVPKCPFCTRSIQKEQLIKLYFQISPDWKQTVTDLETKANSNPNETIINLDDSICTLNLSSLSLEDSV